MAALKDIESVGEEDSGKLSININDVIYTGERSILVSFPFFRIKCDPSNTCFSDSGRLIPTVCVEQHHLAIHVSNFLKYVGFLESDARCDQNSDIPSILAFLEIAHTFSMDTVEEKCLEQLSKLMPEMTAKTLHGSLSFRTGPHLDLTRIIRITASCSPSCRIQCFAIWAKGEGDIQNSPEFQQIISHAWVSLPISDIEKLATCQASGIILANYHASIVSELCRLVVDWTAVVWCNKCKASTTNFHACCPTMYHPGHYKCGYNAGWSCCSATLKRAPGCTILEKSKTSILSSSCTSFQTSVVKACIDAICNKSCS